MPFSPVAALLLQLDRESQRIKSSSTLPAGSKVVRSSSKVINNVSILKELVTRSPAAYPS